MSFNFIMQGGGGGLQPPVENSDLAPMGAASIKANATDASATPQDIVLGNNEVLAGTSSDTLVAVQLGALATQSSVTVGQLPATPAALAPGAAPTLSGAPTWVAYDIATADITALSGAADDLTLFTLPDLAVVHEGFIICTETPVSGGTMVGFTARANRNSEALGGDVGAPSVVPSAGDRSLVAAASPVGGANLGNGNPANPVVASFELFGGANLNTLTAGTFRVYLQLSQA